MVDDVRHERPPGSTLEEHAAIWVDMVPHLDLVRTAARTARVAVEFGVRGGVSTWALLDGLPPEGRLVSVDLIRHPLPQRITTDPRWEFVRGDSLSVPLPDADLFVIDSSHEYEQTLGELRRADRARTILLHDWSLEAVRHAIVDWMGEGWLLSVAPSEWGMGVLTRVG